MLLLGDANRRGAAVSLPHIGAWISWLHDRREMSIQVDASDLLDLKCLLITNTYDFS